MKTCSNRSNTHFQTCTYKKCIYEMTTKVITEKPHIIKIKGVM